MKISPKKPMSFDIDSRFSTEDLGDKSYGFYYPTPGICELLVKMARIVEFRGDCDHALALAQAACKRTEKENLNPSHVVESFEYFWGLKKKYGEEEFRFLDQVETLARIFHGVGWFTFALARIFHGLGLVVVGWDYVGLGWLVHLRPSFVGKVYVHEC